MARVRGVTASNSRSRSSVQRPLRKSIGTSTGRAPEHAQRAGVVGPGGRGDDDLVALARDQLHDGLDRLHAARGDEEILGSKARPKLRCVIAGQRLAQFGNAALPGVEGLAVEQRFRRGPREGLGCRLVSLARPQRNDARHGEAIHGGLDDAAVGLVAGLRGDGGEKLIGVSCAPLSQKRTRVSSTRASACMAALRQAEVLAFSASRISASSSSDFGRAGGRRRRLRLLHAVRRP